MGMFRQGERKFAFAPYELMIKLRDFGNCKNFVESGTCHGTTAEWAARHFQKVYTCEISKE